MQANILHGHWGIREIYDPVARKVLFPHMKDLIVEFVRSEELADPIESEGKAGRGGERYKAKNEQQV